MKVLKSPSTHIFEKNEVFNKTSGAKSNNGLPAATLDLSSGPNGTVVSAKGLELSTLV